MQGDQALRITRDLALAAYLKLRGLRIVRALRKGRHDWEFTFEDPNRQWDTYAVEFTNSECRRYDDEMRALKKLAGEHRKNGNGKRR